MRKRNLLAVCTLAGVVGAFAIACTDTPTATDTLPEPGIPLFGLTDPFNGSGGCMGDDALAAGRVGGMKNASDLNCTANDIYIAEAFITGFNHDEPINDQDFTPFNPLEPIECVEGAKIWVQTTARLAINATERYDIGVWIAEDGGDALTGTCGHWNLLNEEAFNHDGDSCGDMSSGVDQLVDLGMLELTCSPNQEGFLEVGACLGWNNNKRQQCPLGGDDPINFRYGTTPETKAKCNCEPFVLPITVLKEAHLEVAKVCDPEGWDANFDLVIDGADIDEIRAADEGCGGSTGRQLLGAGTNLDPGADYTFAEYAGTSTDLGHFDTTWECRTAVGNTLVDSGDGSGPEDIHLEPGDDIICTFTNVVKRATLTLEKTVNNDHGGTATASDFQAYIDDDEVDWDDPQTLLPGSYTASEDVVTGYTAGAWGGDCAADGSITLSPGQDATCTITNSDIAPTLTLVKTVVGGTAVVADFQAYINGITVDWGASNELSAGNHTASEDVVAGYEAGDWGGDCAANGSVSLALGDNKTCTITNTFVPVETCEAGDRVTSVTLKVISASPDPLRIDVTDDNGPNYDVLLTVDAATVGTTFVVNPEGGATFFDSQNLRFALGPVGGPATMSNLKVHLSCSDDPQVGDLYTGSVGSFSVTLKLLAFSTTSWP
jgi:hypothetical protein